MFEDVADEDEDVDEDEDDETASLDTEPSLTAETLTGRGSALMGSVKVSPRPRLLMRL